MLFLLSNLLLNHQLDASLLDDLALLIFLLILPSQFLLINLINELTNLLLLCLLGSLWQLFNLFRVVLDY